MSTDTTMRAAVLEAVGGLPRATRAPRPKAGPGAVLVQVEACGVGLTVRNKLRRIGAEQLPRIPGHELVGIVVELGPGVSAWSLGDRVAAYYYLYCGRCRHCTTGWQNLCARGARRVGEHVDGGFAEYVCLPASNLVAVPPALAAVEATVACDALGTSLHVCKRADVAEGTRLVVLGAAGGVGVHLVQVAARRGGDVVGVDLGVEKVAALEALGVGALDAAANPEWWRDRTGAVDVVVDLVGTARTFEMAYRLLDDGGRLVRMVTYQDISQVNLGAGLGVGERTVTGSRYCSVRELADALDELAAGRVRPVVGAIRPLADLGSIMSALDDRSLIGRAAVVP